MWQLWMFIAKAKIQLLFLNKLFHGDPLEIISTVLDINDDPLSLKLKPKTISTISNIFLIFIVQIQETFKLS